MARKEAGKRQIQKKLALSKETIRDLTPSAAQVKGGLGGNTEPLNPSAGRANTCNTCVCG